MGECRVAGERTDTKIATPAKPIIGTDENVTYFLGRPCSIGANPVLSTSFSVRGWDSSQV